MRNQGRPELGTGELHEPSVDERTRLEAEVEALVAICQEPIAVSLKERDGMWALMDLPASTVADPGPGSE